MAEEIKVNVKLNLLGKLGHIIAEFGLWLMHKGTSIKYIDPNDRKQDIDECIAQAFRKEKNSQEVNDSQV
jgi:hypothetical protein